MIHIPVFPQASADFSQEIDLNGQLVQLRIVYNIRTGFFFLHLIDADGNTLKGIKMVPNWALLDYHKSFVNFSGDLMMVKAEEVPGTDITYDNFGTVWQLWYLTETEVNIWKDNNGLR